jgi:hypothetical protein
MIAAVHVSNVTVMMPIYLFFLLFLHLGLKLLLMQFFSVKLELTSLVHQALSPTIHSQVICHLLYLPLGKNLVFIYIYIYLPFYCIMHLNRRENNNIIICIIVICTTLWTFYFIFLSQQIIF